MKCPSADNRMPRQKISNDCWPHSTNGRAAALLKKRALRGTQTETSTTRARNGTRRNGDRLFLLTGHNSLINSPGNPSHSPWTVQLSLITEAATKITMAKG